MHGIDPEPSFVNVGLVEELLFVARLDEGLRYRST